MTEIMDIYFTYETTLLKKIPSHMNNSFQISHVCVKDFHKFINQTKHTLANTESIGLLNYFRWAPPFLRVSICVKLSRTPSSGMDGQGFDTTNSQTKHKMSIS